MGNIVHRHIHDIEMPNYLWQPSKPAKTVKPNLAFDTETSDGYVYLIADSNGRKLALKGLEEYLDFLMHDEYRKTVNWFYNLTYDTNSLLKFLDRDQRKEIVVHNQLDIYGRRISIILNKELKISTLKEGEYNKDGTQKINNSTFYYDLAQFYDFKRLKDLARLVNMEKVEVKDISNINWTKYQIDQTYHKLINDRCIIDSDITKRLADKLTVEINKMVVINKYKSKASIARKYVLENLKKKLHLPDHGLLQASLDCYHAGHIETMSMGMFNNVYNADINCFSEDTELLTIDGFKKYTEIKVGDKVATLNIDNGNIEYQAIEHVHIHEYNGEMINISNTKVDIFATPNHRIYYQAYNRSKTQPKKYKTWGGYQIKELKDIPKTYIRIPTGGEYTDGKREYTDNEIKLFGWIVTEGWFTKSGIHISQSDKWNYQEEIKTLLDDLNIEYSVRNRGKRNHIKSSFKSNYDEYDFYIFAKDSKSIKEKMNHKKEINQGWIKHWDKESLKVLFWTLMRGDGSGSVNGGDKNKLEFKGSDHDLDCVLEICLKIGYKANINYKAHAIYISQHQDNRFHLLTMANKNTVRDKKMYKGKVWCVTVSNDTIFVKRNGKTFVTGNSAYPSAMANLYETDGIYQRNRQYEPDATYSYFSILIDYDNKYLSPLWFNKGNNNYHATGLFDTWVTKSEYEYLESMGYKIVIKKAYHLKSIPGTTQPFKNIIHDLYARRLEAKAEGDDIQKVIKVILNSMYGVTINTVLKYEETEEDTDIWIINAFNEIISYKKTFKATNMYNPLFATEITALTRMKIFNDFKKYYKDINAISTDGIYLKRKPHGLKVDKELGNYSMDKINKYLLLGSGRYFNLNRDGTVNDKESRFRGVSMNTTQMFGAMDMHRDRKNIEVTKTKVIKIKESLKNSNYYNLTFSSFPIQNYVEKDLFNTFQEVPKKINFYESRRKWFNEFETIQDIFDIQLESRPFNVNEL